MTEKEFKPIGGGGEREMTLCYFCRKLIDEDEITKTKNGKYACENCYDPADPEQSNSEEMESVELQEKIKIKYYEWTNTC